MRRTGTFWTLAVVAFGALVIAGFWSLGAREAGPRLGFPLDDAWIHVRFAQNLAGGRGFAFNPGEQTAGSTAPLWVVLLAGASLISREFVVTAILLGVLSYLLLGACTYWAARRMLNEAGAAVLAALIVLVNVRVAWAALSGMETCLAALLALVAVASFATEEANHVLVPTTPDPDRAANHGSDTQPGRTRNIPLAVHARAWATPIFFGLASLARPEAHLLFILAVFLRIARSCDRNTPIRALVRLVPYRMIGIYILVIAPWHLFALWSSGSPLPNTFRANFRGLATRVFPPGYYSSYARWLFLLDHPWIYWFVPLGVVATAYWSFGQRGQNRAGMRLTSYGLALAQLSVLWVVCYPIAARMILPMMRHHARYMIPMSPFHAILSVLGVWAAVRMAVALHGRWGSEGGATRPGSSWEDPVAASGRQAPEPATSRRVWLVGGLWLVLFLATAFSAAPGLIRWAAVYGRNVHNINRQHVAMAEWVRDHTPADSLIATHDIGALGAISQRPVMDLFGLVTPTMIRPVRTVIPTLGIPSNWYLERLREREAIYLVGYPDWLIFIGTAPQCFEELHREVLGPVTTDNMDVSGGREMVAYRIRRDELAEILLAP